jgi:hypothetical protein
LLARGKAWKALAVQTELFDPPPPVRRVNLDKIEGVIREKDGTPVVIATRGGRQYRISLPESVAVKLAVKLRDLD